MSGSSENWSGQLPFRAKPTKAPEMAVPKIHPYTPHPKVNLACSTVASKEPYSNGTSNGMSSQSSQTSVTTSTAFKAFRSRSQPPTPFWAALSSPKDIAGALKPDSKVPVARLSYPLQKLPDLYVVEVEVSAGDEIDLVKSKKLRFKALKELVNQPKYSDFNEYIAINLDARRNVQDPMASKQMQENGNQQNLTIQEELINHLIIPVPANTKVESIRNALVSDRVIQLKHTKMEVARSQKSLGEKGHKSVYCKVLDTGKVLRSNDKTDLYAKCMTMVFRTCLSKKNSSLSQYELDTDYWDKRPVDGDFASWLPVESSFRVMRRYRPKVEMSQHGYKLHFDYDVTVVIPKGMSVPELLEQYFSSLVPDVSRGRGTRTPRVKELLRGLIVQYDSGPEKPAGRPKGGVVESGMHPNKMSPDSPNEKENSPLAIRMAKEDKRRTEVPPSWVIKDIKPASEIGPIFDQRTGRYCGVNEFLGEVSAPAKAHLPLANIGGTKPFWVRLESLRVHQHQALKCATHFTHDLRVVAANMTRATLKTVSIHLAQDLSSIRPDYFRPKEQIAIQHISRPTSDPPVAKVKRTPAMIPSSTNTADIPILTIVYISPRPPSPNFLNQVKKGLLHCDQKIIRVSDEIRTATATSAQDLIRQQAANDSALWQSVFYPKRCDIILGVIDHHGVVDAKCREIEAELKRFGDRKPGVVTVCLRKDTLEGFLNSRRDKVVFPPNVLRKLNFMLGNPNWEIPEWNSVKNILPNVMIAGAHISHPDPGSTEFCPSVAAVVGSISPTPILYPGSTRLELNKTTPPYQIENLQAMMKERFDAWLKANPGGQNPDVLFYRKAYDIEDIQAYMLEVESIKIAYKEVFNGVDMRLTYVILTKNIGHQINVSEKVKCPLTFTSSDDPKTARYQYHVAHNGLELSKTALAKVTATLNLTSQLGHRTTIALPLRYAEKLSRRVFDYFRFFSHKDVSNMPIFARPTPYNWKELNEKSGESFLRFVQEFLEIDTMMKNNEDAGHFDQIREHIPGEQQLPWKPSLDNKMFYL